jgi:DNA-binding XRE family transcriptional regulator
MGRTIGEKVAQLPKARRDRIERRTAELIDEELSLRELRRLLGRTQVTIADTLKVGQDTVARYEQRSDMLLSTLRRYIEAVGGDLSLIVQFPGRRSVKLTGIGDINPNVPPRTQGRRESPRRLRTA